MAVRRGRTPTPLKDGAVLSRGGLFRVSVTRWTGPQRVWRRPSEARSADPDPACRDAGMDPRPRRAILPTPLRPVFGRFQLRRTDRQSARSDREDAAFHHRGRNSISRAPLQRRFANHPVVGVSEGATRVDWGFKHWQWPSCWCSRAGIRANTNPLETYRPGTATGEQ